MSHKLLEYTTDILSGACVWAEQVKQIMLRFSYQQNMMPLRRQKEFFLAKFLPVLLFTEGKKEFMGRN